MINYKVAYRDSINENIVINSKGKIFSYSIKRTGSSFLKLFFSKINLPQYSYVEFHYGKNAIQRDFFHTINESVIIIPDEKVNIRVIFKGNVNLDDVFSIELSFIEYNGNSRAIIGQDERRPYMCYEGTEMAEHALASAGAKIGGWGSCSLIGNKNHVLTNQHVVISNPDLTYGEVWFNWFNQSCNPESPVNEPVRLKPGHLLKMGPSGGDNDYALFTLDDFDYVNSNVRTLFGGLELSAANPNPGENIYIPQYGNGGLRPMYISDIKDGEYAKILKIENDGNKITYNADTQGGSSGSPVISRESNQIVGLHWGGGGVNIGVSAQKLNFELGSIIRDSNVSVSGLGKTISFNIDVTPFDKYSYLVPIDLDKKGVIFPFDTVKVSHYENYSLIEVEAIELITNEKFTLTFKASLVNDGYQTNIHDNNIEGKAFLKIYDFDFDINIYGLVKFWMAFKVNDPINNIRNYVIRTVLDRYDAYHIPFDIDSAEVLDFKIRKIFELKASSVSYTIEGSDNYGFVALYNGQGPLNLVGAEDGYSEVKALLRHPSGDEILVNLRGVRQTECSTRTMNSSVACQSSNKYSRLILSFHPEDNENLAFKDDGIYEGIIPLQARAGNNINTENILINVSLEDDTYNSGPEELHPVWSPDSVEYYVGDIVEYYYHLYRCIQDNVSNGDNSPVSTSKIWQLLV